MSSLAERLAAARRQAEASQATTPTADPAAEPAAENGAPGPAASNGSTATDPGPAPGGAPGAAPGGAAGGAQSAGPAPGAAKEYTSTAAEADARRRAAQKPAEPTSRRRGAGAETERIEELKGHVHTELVKQLGPHLYAADVDQADLESRVRQVLSDVLSRQELEDIAANYKRVAGFQVDALNAKPPIVRAPQPRAS